MGGKRYDCSKCDASYTALQRLNEHVVSVHEGTRFECAECDASFPVLRSLNYHISVVHEGKRYDCSLCEAKFTALHSLDRHMTRKHEENSNSVQEGENKFPKELPRKKYQQKPLSCEKCDYTTNKRRYLIRHTLNIHEDLVKNDPLEVTSEKEKDETSSES